MVASIDGAGKKMFRCLVKGTLLITHNNCQQQKHESVFCLNLVYSKYLLCFFSR